MEKYNKTTFWYKNENVENAKPQCIYRITLKTHLWRKIRPFDKLKNEKEVVIVKALLYFYRVNKFHFLHHKRHNLQRAAVGWGTQGYYRFFDGALSHGCMQLKG